MMLVLDMKPTRGPKPTLTLERVMSAAIEIADAESLEAQSMRKVAEALGVGTMSLYRRLDGRRVLRVRAPGACSTSSKRSVDRRRRQDGGGSRSEPPS